MTAEEDTEGEKVSVEGFTARVAYLAGVFTFVSL